MALAASITNPTNLSMAACTRHNYVSHGTCCSVKGGTLTRRTMVANDLHHCQCAAHSSTTTQTNEGREPELRTQLTARSSHSTCKPLHHDIFEIATVLAHPTQAVQRFVLCCNFVSPAEMARSGLFAAGALALIVLAVSAPSAVAGPLWDYVNTPDPTFAVRGLLAG